MATRIVEGKKPYTGGKAIEITKDKVINLKLRDENNLIIYDEGDDEIYVDLQLADGIEPTDAFPVGVNTGRVLVADDWDKTGTLVVAKTTSGDYIELLYADDGTLWMDNGTGTFKQILFKGDIDTIVTNLTNYVDGELAKKQDLTVVDSTAPEDPTEGLLWYDTSSNTLKIYDGTTWQSTGSGGGGGGSTIEYKTQAEYDALPSSKLTDGKHYFIYTVDSPTPPSPGRQPGANTVAYYPLTSTSTVNDMSGNNYNLSNGGASFGVYQGVDCAYFDGSGNISGTVAGLPQGNNAVTISCWLYLPVVGTEDGIFGYGRNAQHSSFQICGWSDFLGIRRYYDDVTVGGEGPYVGTWTHVVGINSGLDSGAKDFVFYVNGVEMAYTGGANNMRDTTLYIGGGILNNMEGYISNCIVENVARTQQEITDYYDQTKANYGIS